MPLTHEEQEHDPRAERADVEPAARDGSERTMRSLAREFANELSALVTAEVALAKAEVGEKVTRAERGIASISVGATALLIGILLLHLAAIFALATVWPAWLAALVIGGGTFLLGALLAALGGTTMWRGKLTPRRTIESLRRDQEFVRQQRRQAMEA